MAHSCKHWTMVLLTVGALLLPAPFSLAQQLPVPLPVPALAELQKEFPSQVFADDFSQHADGDYPDGWQAMALLGQPAARVEGGAFRILTGVNIHCIQPLQLTDFLLKYRVRGETRQPNKLFCHMPCFRVNPADHTGYTVFHQIGRYAARHVASWKVKEGDITFRCSLHDLAYGAFEDATLGNHAPLAGVSPAKYSELAGRDVFDTTAWHDMAIAAKAGRFYVFQDGLLMGEFTDAKNRYPAGRIGFTMAGSQTTQPGAMYLDDVQVYAPQPVREEIITDLKGQEISWKFNRVHLTPVKFDVQVARCGNGYVLRGTVRGGACDAPTQPHIMLNPYVKLETVDGRHVTKLYLYRGTVGRVNIDGAIPPPPFGPADTSGPQQAQCWFDYAPGKHRISMGYEYYAITPGATLAGPAEIVVDAATGQVVHEGLPLRDGAVLTMRSPPEKKVLERVTPANPLRAGFKEFLADNHFFVDGEKLVFCADLLQARPNPALKFQAEFRVKDAFKDRVLRELTRPLAADLSPTGQQQAAAGLSPLTSGWADLGHLVPGVYHLEITARDSDGAVLSTLVKAFSVLPAKVDLEQTPAERSGLPLLSGENKYVMQPAYQADPYHYSCAATADDGCLDAAELQFALNKRVCLAVDLSTPAAVEKVRPYLPYATGVSAKLPEAFDRVLGTPRIYSGDFNFFIQDFVKSPQYKSVAGHDLAEEAAKAQPDYEKLRNEVKRQYWKAFTGYVVQRRGEAVRSARDYLQKIKPGILCQSYAYPYPCNIDYMTPYGGITSAGIDLKNQGWERDVGALEAYYDECRYAPERDWACLALMKMVQPAVRYAADDEGYVSCIEDPNNSFAWPPFGTMQVGSGFFKKEALITALCPVYFRDGKCRWAWDNMYRLGYHQSPQLNELLDGFKLVQRHAPERPVQTVAYVYAQEWIAQHPEVLDPALYPYNPADESLVFAYEEGCRAGVANGFFTDVTDLAKLDREQVNTLVLPPLKYADEKTRQAIRRWHAQGVNLVGFEDVTGLEDLFGVKRLEPAVECAAVRLADSPVAREMLFDVAATEVPHAGNLKTVGYALAGGLALLSAADQTGKESGPVLVLNRGPQAATLLWTLEPTDIARSRNHVGDRMRGECASELLRFAMGRGLKAVADTPVTTTAGNLLAYWQKDGKLCVMVYENAFPFPSQPIHPLVKIRMKGIGKYRLESDKAYRLGLSSKDELSFSCDLTADELAIFTLSK